MKNLKLDEIVYSKVTVLSKAYSVIISAELDDGSRISKEIEFSEIAIESFLGSVLIVINALNDMEKRK
jgi:hypothetical protein